MRAFVAIREQPFYRRDAFVAGLEAAGHEVTIGEPARPDANTLYVSWNRYGHGHDVATRVEAAGGKVLIAENGYVGKGGLSPHSMERRDPYALARRFHNDSSVVRMGAGDRWSELGVELKPWREDGRHILVCPNRSFGMPGRIMRGDWAERTKERLRLIGRPVKIREHPGNDAPKTPLADDLVDCWAVVIWSSSVGVHALIAGVPVICMAPAWIALEAAGRSLEGIGQPAMPDRLPVLQRLAWSQFTVDEIASGFPFRHLV